MSKIPTVGELLIEIEERKRILDSEHDIHYFNSSNDSTVPDIVDDVRNFECKNNCIVYAVIYNEFEEIGNHLTLLYVPFDNKDEWEAEKEALKAMEPIAYVMNLTYPELSEFGAVVLRSHDGVLERIG